MNIEKESKWVKDGQVYTVSKVEEVLNPRNDTEILVWFSDGMVEYYATTQPLFLEQYKPYETTEVYQWAYISNSLNKWHISDHMTEEEFNTWQGSANLSLMYERLDFTKRERK